MSELVKKAEMTFTEFAEALEKDMLVLYKSPIISNETLQVALGYSSLDALRQAIRKHRVGVPVFNIENRNGKYALVKDVARYLAEKRFTSTNLDNKEVCQK